MLAPALVGLLLASPLRLLFEATTTAGARPFGLERARAAGRVLEVARACILRRPVRSDFRTAAFGAYD